MTAINLLVFYVESNTITKILTINLNQTHLMWNGQNWRFMWLEMLWNNLSREINVTMVWAEHWNNESAYYNMLKQFSLISTALKDIFRVKRLVKC